MHPRGQSFKNQDNLMLTLAELTVLRALELAGSRLRARESRYPRSRLAHVAKWNTHIELRARIEDLEKLLKGAWDIPKKAGLPPGLLKALETYCHTVLIEGTAYNREGLRAKLKSGGFIS
jgi:hypothetical protein